MLTAEKQSKGGGAPASGSAPGQNRAVARHDDGKAAPWTALVATGTQFSPDVTLVWAIGLLACAACIAPWVRRGWPTFEMIGALALLLFFYDALALWGKRQDCSPVLLRSEKGLRGREGQKIHLPLGFISERRSERFREMSVALMPSSRESESALELMSREPQWLRLESERVEQDPSAAGTAVQFWPWQPEVLLLRRGKWPVPRVGVQRLSPLGLWRLRQWFEVPETLRVEADLRPGRRELLRSPVYRALVASQQTPWTGHGRDFERVREYQPGDNYAEIAWKSTARRGAPVTRLFQWEQKQEVYFVIDQSRASSQSVDSAAESETGATKTRGPRRFLDLAVETALVGATVALELGDEFGLVTYADEPKSWLRAGSGQNHFHQFRERLVGIEPLPTTADYEALFAGIRVALRRRAYLLLLADLAERSVSTSFRRGVGMVRSSHAVLITSLLPANARPAFSEEDGLETEQEVYARLAGDKESQRLGALTRQMNQMGVQLRYVPPKNFLRSAVEGYLESKREQRL